MIFGGSGAAFCAAGVLIVAAPPLAAQAPRIVTAQKPAPVVSTSEPQIVRLPKATEPVLADEAVTVEVPVLVAPVEVSGRLTTTTTLAHAQTRPAAKPPSGSQPPPGRRVQVTPTYTRPAHQGFSVVLVLADISSGSASTGEDVPPAARRALADMKDFLPYKSYKLLDAAWLLGQGMQTIRLRGVNGHEYELRLSTPGYSTSSGRVAVQFSLRDAMRQDEAVEAALMAHTLQSRSEHAERLSHMSRLSAELRQAREKQDTARIREIEKQMSALNASMAKTESNLRRASSGTRPIIDTSFSMEVGETVVVGTSRLEASSGALIALLTAVPPRSSTIPPKETR